MTTKAMQGEQMYDHEQQIKFLRLQYQQDAVARAVLDNFADRKYHLADIRVDPVAKQCSLSEDQVKDFYRLLQAHEFGKYIKSSKGAPARFRWGTSEELIPGSAVNFLHNYSLVLVGRAARDPTCDSLDLYEQEDDQDEGGKDVAEGETSISFPLPFGRKIDVCYPQELSAEELDSALSWLRMHLASTVKRQR